MCIRDSYTLLLGLLAIWACDRIPQPFLRAAVLLGLFLLSVPGDWGAYAVGWCPVSYTHLDVYKRQPLSRICTCWWS